MPGRLSRSPRRRRIRRHHADRRRSRRPPKRWPNGSARRSMPISTSTAITLRVGLDASASASIRRTASTRRRWSPMPMPRCSARSPKCAARSASSSWRWTSSCARGARCSRICASAILRGRTRAPLSAAGAYRRRDHRLRGAGALASSAPRAGAAEHLHPARRGERPHHRDRRMDPAHGLPRGRLLAAAAAHRDQSVAGAVPARRPAAPGASDPAGNRSCAVAARTRDHRGRADRRFHARAWRSCAA